MCLAGSGEHILNGQKHPILPGSMFLVTPTDVHELHVFKPLRYQHLLFTEELLDGSLLFHLTEHCKGRQVQLSAPEWERIESLFSCLQEETISLFPDSLAFIQRMLTCILILMRRKLPVLSEPDSSGGILSAVLYIQRHFREKLTLDAVAAQAGFSSSYFCQRFSECVGMGFHAYCCELRLKYARNLLLSSDLSITEICYQSGFGSLSGFSREFHRRYHVSPRQMRKQGSPVSFLTFPDAATLNDTRED